MGTVQSGDYYRLSVQEVLQELDASEEGLTAEQAATRLQKHGPNSITTGLKSPFMALTNLLKRPLITAPIASGGILLYLGKPGAAIVLLAIACGNAALGYMRNPGAGRAAEVLKQLAPNQAAVVRSGDKHIVASPELVVGDIVYIEAGDTIPADLRLVEEEELHTDDAALTGEHAPSRKFTHAIKADVPADKRHNLAYTGTTVVSGHAIGIVIATGTQTELGRLAALSDTAPTLGPLQKEIGSIVHGASIVAAILCITLLPITLATELSSKDALLFAVALALVCLPLGLSGAVTAIIMLAVRRLDRVKIHVKRPSAAATLGATHVILTDKTGVLTNSQPTVEHILVGSTSYRVTGTGYEPAGDILGTDNKPITAAQKAKLEAFFTAAALTSSARIALPDSEHGTWHATGNPVESALVTMAMKAGITIQHLDKLYRKIREFPFDAARGRMSSLRYFGSKKEQKPHLFIQGTADAVLEHCVKIWDHGNVRVLSTKDKQSIRKANEQLTAEGLHNVGLAFRPIHARTKLGTLTMDTAERELVWLGMASVAEPLSKTAANAMDAAHGAHIKVSIITDDPAPAAKAMALQVHLAAHAKDITVISGDELPRLSNTRVQHLVQRGGVVFSRISPWDKLRLVQLAQHGGKVVAVTGSTASDIPALAHANVGAVPALHAAAPAKQTADVLLPDGSFSALVHAILEGRAVSEHTRKATLAYLTGSAGTLTAVLASLVAMALFGIPPVLSVMQLLVIALIAELLPIAALGMDQADDKHAHEHPHGTKRTIIGRHAVSDFMWCGLLIGGFALANYMLFYGRYDIPPGHVPAGSLLHMKAMALVSVTVVLCLLVHIVQRRSPHGLFSRSQLHNKQFWLAIALVILLVLAGIYNSWIASYVQMAPIGAVDWVFATGAAVLFAAIREFQRHNKKHSRKAVLELHRTHRLRLNKA